MANKPQNFSTDHILSKLVAYFNALPASQRIIRPTDVPFYNIKVITDSQGNESVVVGDQAKNVDASAYLGEATFTWIGARHSTNPQTATASKFFEISKFVNQTSSGGAALTFRNDVVTYTGPAVSVAPDPSANLPQDGDYTYYIVMTDQYGDGWNNGTIGLVLNGTLYTLTGPETTTQTVKFGAYTSDTIVIVMTNPGNYPEGMIVQVYQVNNGAPMNDSSQVVVRDDSGAIPNDVSTPFLNFQAPYGSIPYWDWNFTALSSMPYADGRYGQSVAVSDNGDAIIISEPGGDKQSTYDSGKVWIYTCDGQGTVTQMQTLTRPQSSMDYGRYVALSSDGLNLAVSAGTQYGSSYVWIYGRSSTSSTFTAQAQLSSSVNNGEPCPIMFAGNDRLYMQNPYDNNSQGSVSVFKRATSTTWTTTPYVTLTSPTNPVDNGLFGQYMATSHDGDFVGIVQFRNSGSDDIQSRLHFFSVDENGAHTMTCDTTTGNLVRSFAMFDEGYTFIYGQDGAGVSMHNFIDAGRTAFVSPLIWSLDDPNMMCVTRQNNNIISIANNRAVMHTVTINTPSSVTSDDQIIPDFDDLASTGYTLYLAGTQNGNSYVAVAGWPQWSSQYSSQGLAKIAMKQ